MPKDIGQINLENIAELSLEDLAVVVDALLKEIEDLSNGVGREFDRVNLVHAIAMRSHGHRHDAVRGGWARDIFKTFDDPEAFATELKEAIPAGTIIVREGVTPRRVYFSTQSGLFRLIASGTTNLADGHSHGITDVSINFKAI